MDSFTKRKGRPDLPPPPGVVKSVTTYPSHLGQVLASARKSNRPLNGLRYVIMMWKVQVSKSSLNQISLCIKGGMNDMREHLKFVI
jgi:hypothetical protein